MHQTPERNRHQHLHRHRQQQKPQLQLHQERKRCSRPREHKINNVIQVLIRGEYRIQIYEDAIRQNLLQRQLQLYKNHWSANAWLQTPEVNVRNSVMSDLYWTALQVQYHIVNDLLRYGISAASTASYLSPPYGIIGALSCYSIVSISIDRRCKYSAVSISIVWYYKRYKQVLWTISIVRYSSY